MQGQFVGSYKWGLLYRSYEFKVMFLYEVWIKFLMTYQGIVYVVFSTTRWVLSYWSFSNTMTQKMGSVPLVLSDCSFEMTFTGLYFLIWFEAVTGVNMKTVVLLEMMLCGLSQIMYNLVPEDSNLYKLYDC
jgi:hypothetical protein